MPVTGERLDQLLGEGPVPPPIAVHIVRAVAATLTSGAPRLARDGLRRSHILVGDELRIVGAPAPDADSEPAAACGALLYELLTGGPYDWDDTTERQLDQVRHADGPGAGLATSLCVGLIGGEALDARGVLERCEAVLARLGGVSLPLFIPDGSGAPGPVVRHGDVPSITTGHYEMGSFARIFDEKPVSKLSMDHDPLASPQADPGVIAPIVEHRLTQSDVEKLRRALEEVQHPEGQTPIPGAPERVGSRGPAVYAIAFVVVLVAAAVAAWVL